MSTESLAAQMVAKYETLLLANPHMKRVQVDGMSVEYDDLLKQYAHWKKQYDREQGRRGVFYSTRLDSAF